MPISPFDFTDYAQQLQSVERRRKLAEALQMQGLQPIENQNAPGLVTPISPFQGLNKLAQGYVGGAGIQSAEQQTQDISKRRQMDLANALREMGVQDEKIPSILTALNMPETAPMGQKQIELQMLKKSLSPQAGTGQSGMAMPPAPIDLLAAGDMGKTVYGAINEQNKPINVRPGGTVYQPGQGPQFTAPQNGVQTQWGPQGPQAGIVPGTAETTTALHNIPQPNAPMIPIKTSTGQDIQLTQPEYLAWQQTGQLPARMGGRPQASGIPRPAAPGVNLRPGLGVPGVGQSQEEQITQERQKAAGKAGDEQFAKDYVAFKTGGAQDATKQLAQLGDVVTALQGGKDNLTGPVVGRVPDIVRGVTNPKAIAMRERVEEVVQRSLRAILGAQFTEKEGERLIARAYNTSQPEAENAIRVKRLMTQLGQALQSKQDAAGYFEKNGTLQGWQGKMPSISDFNVESKAVSTDDLVNKWLR